MTYPVKSFNDSQIGAPALTGVPGSLIALLDACLINGFNLQSVAAVSRVADVATASYSGAHGFVDGQVVLHDVMQEAEYNGEFKVFNVTVNSYDFTVIGSPTTPSANPGTAKAAPVGGWEKRFTATNKAVYRSTDPASTGYHLQVDDTQDTHAVMLGYESMTDVDTGIGIMGDPTESFWVKSSTADAVARPWDLFADSRLIHAFIASGTSQPTLRGGYSFGDIESYRQGDSYNCILRSRYSIQSISGASYYNYWPYVDSGFSVSRNGEWIARSHSQLGGYLGTMLSGSSIRTGVAGGGGLPFPSTVHNGMLLHALSVISGGELRGRFSGVLYPLHDEPLSHGDVIDNLPDYPGRQWIAISVGHSASYGLVFIDTTGPWR